MLEAGAHEFNNFFAGHDLRVLPSMAVAPNLSKTLHWTVSEIFHKLFLRRDS